MSEKIFYKILKVNSRTQHIVKEATLTSDEFEELVFAGSIEASYEKVRPLMEEGQ